MYGLNFRDELPPAVVEELDLLVAKLKAIILREHNEDGTHDFTRSESSPAAITQIINNSQDQGQWWKTGPWKIDDPASATPHKAGLRPANPAAGTYNNYAPAGIDDAVVLEIEPDGDITITGIQALPGYKRLLMIRNKDSTNSITLAHADTGSIEAFRFDLPSALDIELSPNQNAWLYYDPSRERWTAAITPQAAGGLGGEGGSGGGGADPVVQVAEVTISDAELNSLNTSPKELIAAPAADEIIVPLWISTNVNVTGGFNNQTNGTVRWGTVNTAIWSLSAMVPSLGTGRRFNNQVGGLSTSLTTADLRGKKVEVVGSGANSSGTTSGGINVKIGYYIAGGQD